MVGIPCADLRDRHLVIGSGILLVQMLCTSARRGAALVASHAINNKMLDPPVWLDLSRWWNSRSRSMMAFFTCTFCFITNGLIAGELCPFKLDEL